MIYTRCFLFKWTWASAFKLLYDLLIFHSTFSLNHHNSLLFLSISLHLLLLGVGLAVSHSMDKMHFHYTCKIHIFYNISDQENNCLCQMFIPSINCIFSYTWAFRI